MTTPALNTFSAADLDALPEGARFRIGEMGDAFSMDVIKHQDGRWLFDDGEGYTSAEFYAEIQKCTQLLVKGWRLVGVDS